MAARCGICDGGGGFSETLVFFALGLVVMLLAKVGHDVLFAMTESLRVEAHAATLQLLNDLARLPRSM
jgi:hypothetical protein